MLSDGPVFSADVRAQSYAQGITSKISWNCRSSPSQAGLDAEIGMRQSNVRARQANEMLSAGAESAFGAPPVRRGFGSGYDWTGPRCNFASERSIASDSQTDFTTSMGLALLDLELSAAVGRQHICSKPPLGGSGSYRYPGQSRFPSSADTATSSIRPASTRHIATCYGISSGRRPYPRPSDVYVDWPRGTSSAAAVVHGSAQRAEVEELVRARRYWTYGDYLRDIDSVNSALYVPKG